MIKHTLPNKLGILKSQKIIATVWKHSSHSWKSPPPAIKGAGGVGLSNNWVAWGGGGASLLERGANLEKGGFDIEMGRGLPLFYYFTVPLHLLCVGEKIKFLWLYFDSSIFGVRHARLSS